METNGSATATTTARRSRRPLRRGPAGGAPGASFWLTAVAPVAIALLSLALSVYSILDANREPALRLSAPDVVRVAQGEDAAWFYVQSRIVSGARNDRMAVVEGLRLEVAPPGGGEPLAFAWDEQGTWEYDPANRGLTWVYLADPAPLVVGPSAPQLPIVLFAGPPGWRWQPGEYRVTIVAERGPGADPLRAAFAMTLTEQDVASVGEHFRNLIELRTRPA